MKDIAIFGVGGFGREVLTVILDINKVTPQWNVIGFFDDGYPIGTLVNGYKCLGGVKELNQWQKPLALTIAIGTPIIKKKIINNIKNDLIEYPTLIHPSVIIGNKDYVEIGRGCIICAANIFTTNIHVENFVIFNLSCTVGHDTIIKNYAAFMPACNISGEVLVEEGAYCGTGVKIINQTSIGAHSIVGAGAVVTKPIPANSTAVGIPARVIKNNNE